MTLYQIAAVVIGLAALIGVPALMIWAAVDHVRQPARKRRGGSAGGVGGAMQELDRLVARPSVEHVVEAQQQIVSDDERGGD